MGTVLAGGVGTIAAALLTVIASLAGTIVPGPTPISHSASTPSAWCNAVTPGLGSSANATGHHGGNRHGGGQVEGTAGPDPVALSAAHGVVRGFAVDSAFNPADDSLAAALQRSDSLTPADLPATLDRYAKALSDTCALRASDATLGPARVEKLGPVAVVHPGTGSTPVALPVGTEAGVIDLRGLPAVDGLEAALGRAVSPFLRAPMGGSGELARVNHGPKDEASERGVYSTSVNLQRLNPWPASGRSDLPLTIFTDGRLPPAAARFAGGLRLARRAYLAGSDAFSAVAEMTWRGVGNGGLATRTGALEQLSPPKVTVSNGQVIHQDDPNNPSTASYRLDFVVSAAQRIDIKAQARKGLIGLYLLQDRNRDGVFSFPEEVVASSSGENPEQNLTVSSTALGGHYQILVHGYSVPSGTAQFDLTTAVQAGSLWPDVIPADFRGKSIPTSHPRTDPPPVKGPASRSTPLPVDPKAHPVVTGKGKLRAALVVAHGLTRRYYKYFNVVGDRIDSRLVETLAAVDSWNGRDRAAAFDIIRRFGEALHDGHQLTVDNGPPLYRGRLALYLENVGGRPAVRRSAIPSVHPGDTILSIDGLPIEQVYADEYRLTSTATAGYRFDVASRFISRMRGPETLVLADPHGATRTVRVDPQPESMYEQVRAPGATDRVSGPLNDLGAGDIAYLNLNQLSPDQVDAALIDANRRQAKALVVDMRGYPGTGLYSLGRRLIRRPFTSTPFIYNQFDGPDMASLHTSQYRLDPLPAPAWDGPIVLLTGPHAVSQAESFMQMLVAFNRPLAIVGQQSAGTTGEITRAQLPGGFVFRYTGELVVNVDGSRFMGVGIQPDVSVPLTTTDLATGTDRDLLTAIDILRRRGL